MILLSLKFSTGIFLKIPIISVSFSIYSSISCNIFSFSSKNKSLKPQNPKTPKPQNPIYIQVLMELEVLFEDMCYPLKKQFEISETDFTTGIFKEKIRDILKIQGVKVENIKKMKWRLNDTESWKKVRKDPPQEARKISRLQLRIWSRHCNEDSNKEISAMMKLVRNQNEQILQIEQILKEVQSQLFEIKENLLPMNPPVQEMPGEITLSLKHGQSTEASYNKHSVLLAKQKKVPDISYLYSIPLIREDSKNPKNNTPLSNPIDAYKEIESIQKQIEKNDICMTVNVGTLDTLEETLEDMPKILHISCHGGYESDEEGSQKLYLYLENLEMTGIMKKISEEEIRRLFSRRKDEAQNTNPRLVFISACHSQQFGSFICDSGVPNVVAINSYTQIADIAATRFASRFYHFLVQGWTVRKAFEEAKCDLKRDFNQFRLCCCSHVHKPDCSWLNRIQNDQELAHTQHIVECSCKYGGNIHSSYCRWMKTMLEDKYKSEEIIEDHKKSKVKKYRVCCCSPEIPHSEEEKFILFSRSKSDENEILFNNVKEGDLEVKKCFETSMLPSINEIILGRNIILQQLIRFLSLPDIGKKIVIVSGPSGVGKSLLIKTAAKYVMERGGSPGKHPANFEEGFVAIHLPSITYVLSKLNSELLPGNEAEDIKDFSRKIKNYSKIISIECEEVIKNNGDELIKKLRSLFSEAKKVKIILSAKSKKLLPVDEDIEINENLSVQNAYNILKQKNDKLKIKFNYYKSHPISEHLHSPWLIKKAAVLLKDKDATLENVLNELIKQRLILIEKKDVPSIDSGFINSLKPIIEKMMKDYSSPLLFLSQMQYGVLESTFRDLFFEEKENMLQEIDEYIEKDTEIIGIFKKIPVENFRESKIMACEATQKYIDGFYMNPKKKACVLAKYIKKYSIIIRRLVRSYKMQSYSIPSYDEFSSIIDEGIWTSPIIPSSEPSSHLQQLPGNPLVRFECEIDNIFYFLDPILMAKIIQEISASEAQELLNHLIELFQCTFTLLMHCGKLELAKDLAEAIQGFSYNHGSKMKNFPLLQNKYKEMLGMSKLMKCFILYKKREKKNDIYSEILNVVECFAANECGRYEAIFFQSLLNSQTPEKYSEALTGYRDAKYAFHKQQYTVGVIRVNIAEAKLLILMNNISEAKKMLNITIEDIRKRKYLDNMEIECLYELARCHEVEYMFEEAREILLEAQNKSIKNGNKNLLNNINNILTRIVEIIHKGSPLFSILRAFPIVLKASIDNPQIIELDPIVRQSSFFRKELIECFSKNKKKIKVHFNYLAPNILEDVLKLNCAVLHISSNHYEKGTLSFEGKEGELVQIQLPKLEETLEEVIKQSQCKVVVVAIPEASDIADLFIRLGIPHVISFSFSKGKWKEYENLISTNHLQYSAIYKYCIEFYNSLVQKSSIKLADVRAKKVMEEYVKSKVKKLNPKVEDLHSLLNPGPRLVSSELGNEDCIFPKLESGLYVDTSPKRGEFDIEMEEKPFVGRQLLIYKISKVLFNGKNVNLYGVSGTGKTRLAKEIGYSLYMKSLFKAGLHYLEDGSKYLEFQASLLSSIKYEKIENRRLIIIDNINKSFWKKHKHLLMYLKNDKKCVFLFISRIKLDDINPNITDSPFELFCLQPFPSVKNNVILQYIISYLEYEQYFISDSNLKLEKQDRKSLQKAFEATICFQQANGYPILLDYLCKAIMEKKDLCSIDLLEEKIPQCYHRLILTKKECEEKLGASDKTSSGIQKSQSVRPGLTKKSVTNMENSPNLNYSYGLRSSNKPRGSYEDMHNENKFFRAASRPVQRSSLSATGNSSIPEDNISHSKTLELNENEETKMPVDSVKNARRDKPTGKNTKKYAASYFRQNPKSSDGGEDKLHSIKEDSDIDDSDSKFGGQREIYDFDSDDSEEQFHEEVNEKNYLRKEASSSVQDNDKPFPKPQNPKTPKPQNPYI